ncbi:MAG: hypothetical protein ABI054_06600, partial [Planctomycetota bacterium]
TPKDGKFFGNDAELELDTEGKPQSARFEGSPRVELLLRDVEQAGVPGVVKSESGDLPVQMIGAGPLVVQIAGTPHFDFHGPATLILPTLDVTLTAQEKLSGTRLADTDFGRLDAFGGVEAHAAGATLTTQELRIERKLTKEGKLAASLSTDSSAHATGPLEDGGIFDLTALGGLEFVRLEKSFQVPIARDVELDVTGPKRMHAKAREIRDLDESSRSLIGTGDVSFENELGRGTGQRLVSRGPESVELFGAPSTPAHLDFEQGTLDAETLSFEGEHLRAEGDAHAKVGIQGSDYRLDSRWIGIQRHPVGLGVELTLEAGGEVAAHIADPQRTIDLTSDHVLAKAFSATAKLKEVESRGLEASGSVVFHVRGDEELDGSGERLVIEADRSGQLYPADQRRVQVTGRMPKDDLAFEMTAGSVRFAPQSLSAEDPAIEIQGVAAPIGEKGAVPLESPLHAVAGAMSVDPTSILFTEGVYLGQTATKESTWSLDSESLVLTGARIEVPGEPEPRFTITSVLAWGGFQALFSDEVQARGTTLMLDREQNRLTLRGDPTEFDLGGWRIGTEWIEVDLTTGFWRTAAGSATTLDERSGDLEFRFASMEPMNGVDSRIEVVREPSFIDHKHERETRAAWALFWLDEQRLESLSMKLLRRPELGVPERAQEPPPRASGSGNLAQLQALPFLKGVHEAYFEGNIEVLDHGERRVRADSMYIDFVDGHGWLRGFILTVVTPFRSGAKYLKLHADWLSFSPDESARAKHAVVTSCEFDDPHYVINLGDLRMKPRHTRKPEKPGTPGGETSDGPIEGYDVKSKNNSVQFGDSPRIPMPEISFPTDASFSIPPNSFTLFGLRGFSIGNIARFGAFLGLTFDVPLGFFSNQLHRVLSKFPDPPEGSNTADVKYLNARGLLLDGKNSIEQKGVYKLVTRLAVISDTGSDRGLVRVPKDDRDNLRLWLRMRGRRWLGINEWFDFNLTKQTDPGVQAEFFQGDYLRWEARETYLHWRRVRGLTYWRATIETQLDDYRTEVIEEPSAGTTRGRGPIASLWGRDLVYSSDTTLAHLRRIEGEARFNELPFPDGFGEQDVTRVDTTHRLERPMPLGVMQARLVPFIEGRATAWDQGPTGSQSPSRFAVLVGAEASATFWRMYGDGDLHSLTPSIGVRGDVAFEENGGTPAQFDGVEDPLDGQFAEFGLRSRWVKPRDVHRPEEEERFLDIEVRQAYGEHLSGGRPEGWQPLRVNAQWVSELGKVPFGMTHDARYDLELDQTIYSRSSIGVQIIKPLLIETGFNNARDLAGVRLYSAWSLAARYQFSEKWQIEGQETLSTLSDSQLDSSFLLRRLGHDFVVELEYSFTAGEGGSSISLKVQPLLTYREKRLGFLSRLQAQGN